MNHTRLYVALMSVFVAVLVLPVAGRAGNPPGSAGKDPVGNTVVDLERLLGVICPAYGPGLNMSPADAPESVFAMTTRDRGGGESPTKVSSDDAVSAEPATRSGDDNPRKVFGDDAVSAEPAARSGNDNPRKVFGDDAVSAEPATRSGNDNPREVFDDDAVSVEPATRGGNDNPRKVFDDDAVSVEPATRSGNDNPREVFDDDAVSAEPTTRDRDGALVHTREPAPVGVGAGGATGLAAAAECDLAAICYVEEVAGGAALNVSVSSGRGLEWSSPVPVDSSGAVVEIQPDSIAVIGDRIYTAWKDTRFGSEHPEVAFNYSPDAGASWGGDVVIDKGYASGTGAVRDWNMVVTPDPLSGPDHVYIIMAVDPTGASDEDLYLAASHDGGVSFEPSVRVAQDIKPGGGDVNSIALSAEGLSVSILWQDDRILKKIDMIPPLLFFYDVWFQHSSDGGAAWLPDDLSLKRADSPSNSEGPVSVAQLGQTVLAVWLEKRTSEHADELRANISLDGGATWLAAEDLLIGEYEPGLHDADSPKAFFCRDQDCGGESKRAVPVVAWADNRTGVDEIYAASTLDLGATWMERKLSAGGGEEPRIAGGNGSAGVVWTSGSLTVESAWSIDAGLTWDGPATVSNGSGSRAPAVGFDAVYNNFIIAWLSDELGADNVYAGGYRPQTLVPRGDFTPGGIVYFEAHNWPNGTALTGGNRTFRVLISAGMGNFMLPLGDGRNAGLLHDVLLNASRTRAGALSGLLNGDSGQTQQFALPSSDLLPPGTVLYCAAVEVYSSGSRMELGAITDVITVLVH